MDASILPCDCLGHRILSIKRSALSDQLLSVDGILQIAVSFVIHRKAHFVQGDLFADSSKILGTSPFVFPDEILKNSHFLLFFDLGLGYRTG